MVRLTSIISLVFIGLAVALPVPTGLTKRAFTQKAYPAFQISDGTAGNAQAQANAVFIDPFKGRDLTKVTSAELNAVESMRVAAENAEIQQFNQRVSAATGSTATALQNGKIKNKVLKLTGIMQVIKIKIAQGKAAGKDTTSDEARLKDAQTKLNANVALDVKNKGQASKGVV
ncbi:unnamed protein product [Rhizoctonia solani]|uniref:Small secreted protein n=1 Tax=Rhizoctonia solani TaxID=456999 RepID=A0A8H3C1V4_9AGAM|nr:unnamed protein product [Rhizoctonia solani]